VLRKAIRFIFLRYQNNNT